MILKIRGASRNPLNSSEPKATTLPIKTILMALLTDISKPVRVRDHSADSGVSLNSLIYE